MPFDVGAGEGDGVASTLLALLLGLKISRSYELSYVGTFQDAKIIQFAHERYVQSDALLRLDVGKHVLRRPSIKVGQQAQQRGRPFDMLAPATATALYGRTVMASPNRCEGRGT